MGGVGTRLDWNATVVDLPSTSAAAKIIKLRGGESVTIKHVGTADKYIMLGSDQTVSTSNGYKMEAGEVVSISLDRDFGRDKYIEVWGLPEIAGNDVGIIHVIGASPDTEAT